MCEELFGMIPDDCALTGTGLRLKWLCDHFGGGPSDGLSEGGVHQFAQVYILALISSVLFADKSSTTFLAIAVTVFQKFGSFS